MKKIFAIMIAAAMAMPEVLAIQAERVLRAASSIFHSCEADQSVRRQ